LITQGALVMSNTSEHAVVPGFEAGRGESSALGDVSADAPGLGRRDAVAALVGSTQADAVFPSNGHSPSATSVPTSTQVAPSDCGCASCRANAAPRQLVYALGDLGYDYGTESRRDSFQQHMASMSHPSAHGKAWGEEANPHEPVHLLDYLDQNHWDATSVIWTLNVESLPIYAISPQGPFAHECCSRLRQFLRDQLQGVERVSIPGILSGTVRLFTGLTVPVIVPELRGMHNWKTGGLVEATLGPAPAAAADREAYNRKAQGMRNFLERAYYELRNRGLTPQDRAINYAATQTFDVGKVYDSLGPPMELDRIEVEPSPVCRHMSDCWDVKLLFFNPESHVQTVRKVYRMTVDVSDVVPVTVGKLREWFVR
jgi:cyanobactin maturation PatA/PatG family protease